MHKEKIQNLISKSAEERYEYFVRHCADFEEVWGLVVGKDNWVIFKDKQGEEIFPLWPHFELAKICCFEEQKNMGAVPQSIKLNIFIKSCIPNMIAENVYFGIFYNRDRKGLIVNAKKLKKSIENEINSVLE